MKVTLEQTGKIVRVAKPRFDRHVGDVAVARFHQRNGGHEAGFEHVLMKRLSRAPLKFGADVVLVKMKLF